MFEAIFESGSIGSFSSIPAMDALISVGVALIMGLVISLIYIFSARDKKYSANFAVTLILIPGITALIIMLVGSSAARALALGGVFTLVRFRSVPGDSKDISSVFFAMAIGLACGIGYITLAVAATAVIGVVYFAFVKFGYGVPRIIEKQLKITIPEDLNYYDAFTDLFEEYTVSSRLVRVKTVNLGTLYQVVYHVKMKKGADEKKFLDSLRCRNGNLNIMLGLVPEKESL